MNIAVIGINHNLSPISIREQVSFTDTKKIDSINILLDREINEIVILSTCNRSEIYISCEDLDKGIETVSNFYKEFFNLDNIKSYLFSKKNEEAIKHLFVVTAGLDSLVIGEDQILGQVKEAHEFSMKLGATKKLLNKLFREAVTTSKQIKTTTKISQQPLSISYIGIKLLKEKLGDLDNKNIFIIGLGKMNLLTMKHLQEENIGTIYITNRSAEKFKEIENKYNNIEYVDYKDRYNILKDDKIDIVISATSSPHLVMRYEDMPVIKNKIHFMDLALPRDIDFRINDFDYASLYCIDDLKEIQHRNDDKRNSLSKEAYVIINEKIKEFINWQDVSNIDPTIQSLNKKCVEIKEDTLEYIFRKLDLGQKDKKIIDKMLDSALKRLIREPIINLKQTKNKGKREEYMKTIEELFDI